MPIRRLRCLRRALVREAEIFLRSERFKGCPIPRRPVSPQTSRYSGTSAQPVVLPGSDQPDTRGAVVS